MHLETLSFDADTGWSRPFPPLDSECTLVVAFGASCYADAPAPLRALREAYPQAHLVGCSTAGEIAGQSIADGTLVVAVARFEHTRLATAAARVTSSDESFAAARRLAESLRSDDLRAILVLSDGLGVNGSELVRGFNSALPESVVVTGGLAGDGDRFARTWVMNGRGPEPGVVVAVGLRGNRVRVGHGSKGGWDIFGPERRVTRSQGNVLYELDGRPALALYKQYLGERASGLPATALLFPLALRAEGDTDKTLVRTVLAVDEQTQSMTFAGNVPEGSRCQLMRANFERLIEGASHAALHARSEEAVHGPTLAIAISCVGRRLILGERTEEEIEAALVELPPDARLVGFYSYGEISPYASGHCDLHNQTMTLTTIAEG